MAAMRGEPVDRAPIWLREGFFYTQPLAEADSFANGWQADPLYRELYYELAPHVDVIRGWGGAILGKSLGGWSNRFMMIPPEYIHSKREVVGPDLERSFGTVVTPRGDLTYVNEFRRGHDTAWHVKTLVQSVDDLKKLASVPYNFDPTTVEQSLTEYEQTKTALGDRGVLRLGFSSPMVCISGAMNLETFLEFSLTQKPLFHELMAQITYRNLTLIDAIFKGRELDTTVNIGGSEQCTPPMMPPQAFDEYVVPYEGQMVERLKSYGILVNCHCHGKVRHALQCMVDMGIDSTDPVEPPPAGNVTWAEARQIAGNDLTLIGNFEFDALCFAETDHIRERVREMLSKGTRRMIMGASAGPISAVSPQLAANYRAWIETARELS